MMHRFESDHAQLNLLLILLAGLQPLAWCFLATSLANSKGTWDQTVLHPVQGRKCLQLCMIHLQCIDMQTLVMVVWQLCIDFEC